MQVNTIVTVESNVNYDQYLTDREGAKLIASVFGAINGFKLTFKDIGSGRALDPVTMFPANHPPVTQPT